MKGDGIPYRSGYEDGNEKYDRYDKARHKSCNSLCNMKNGKYCACHNHRRYARDRFRQYDLKQDKYQ
jgi:hypothetical protein